MQDLNTGIVKTVILEGISVENVASQFGLHQRIKDPTDIFENSTSYIDITASFNPFMK